MTDTEVFTFPKTRKSRAARKFIDTIAAKREPLEVCDRLDEEAVAEEARLKAITHDPANHSFAEILDAQIRLDAFHAARSAIYSTRQMHARSDWDVDAELLQEVLELASDEAEAEGNAELDRLRKQLPRGAKIDMEAVETPAVLAYRHLSRNSHHAPDLARQLYGELTA